MVVALSGRLNWGACSLASRLLSRLTERFYKGTVEITDIPVVFDNKFFFSYNIQDKINILCIEQKDHLPYFEKLFSDTTAFRFNTFSLCRNVGFGNVLFLSVDGQAYRDIVNVFVGRVDKGDGDFVVLVFLVKNLVELNIFDVQVVCVNQDLPALSKEETINAISALKVTPHTRTLSEIFRTARELSRDKKSIQIIHFKGLFSLCRNVGFGNVLFLSVDGQAYRDIMTLRKEPGCHICG